MKYSQLRQLIREEISNIRYQKQSDIFQYFRSMGLTPDNQPVTPKYILYQLQPGKNFVDISGDLYDGPYYLKYKGNERSVYIFNKININTNKVEEELYISCGNLTKLRKVYSTLMENKTRHTIVVTRRDEEYFDEFFKDKNLKYISKKIIPKPKEMFGMMSNAIEFDFGDKIDNVIDYLRETDLNYSLI